MVFSGFKEVSPQVAETSEQLDVQGVSKTPIEAFDCLGIFFG